jgi:hypothetical protein
MKPNELLIFSGPFSQISLIPERGLLLFVWKGESKTLTEESVKFEISRILDFVKEYHVENIIVDTVNYSFRDNLNLQNWINKQYMPLIMDCNVKKYALIVDLKTKTTYDDLDKDDAEFFLPAIEYFTDLEEAKKWIKLAVG